MMRLFVNIQMDKWNGYVLDARRAARPRKCSQRIGLHALSGCDTVSYPSRKGKKSALKLLDIDITGYDQVFGQPSTTNAQLKATTASFFLLFYGLKSCTTMDDARARVFYGPIEVAPD